MSGIRPHTQTVVEYLITLITVPSPNVMVELTFLLRFRDVPGSYFSLETDYPDCEFL